MNKLPSSQQHSADDRYWPIPAQTLVLAGGGNRCWWQAGLLSALCEQGAVLPDELIGTSAGAAIALAAVSGRIEEAKDACERLYAANQQNFRWRGLLSLKLEFAHQHVYPAWLCAFVSDDSVSSLRQLSSRLFVAVSRPAPFIGLTASVCLGTLAYVVDHGLWHRMHPQWPRRLGLRLDYLPVHECETAADAIKLMCAAAAPPPILPAQRLGGAFAFDGGYTDNASIPYRLPTKLSGSLTLLTRHYPHRKPIFREQHRWYWQPSQRIPVSTWDCTFRASIVEAFNLGRKDALTWLSYGHT